MITADIGDYYKNTQRELDQILSQIDQLSQADKNGVLGENLKHLYSQIQLNMTQIQGNINQNQDFFFDQLLNNFDQTVQKLPVVDDPRSQSKKNHRRLNAPTEINLPSIDSLVTFKGKSALEYYPLGQQSYIAKGTQNSQSIKQPPTILKNNKLSKGSASQVEIGTKIVLKDILKNSQANLNPFKQSLNKQHIQLESGNEVFKLDLQGLQAQQINNIELKNVQQSSYPASNASSIYIQQQRNKISNKNIKKLFNDSSYQSQLEVKQIIVTPTASPQENLYFTIKKGQNLDLSHQFVAFKRQNIQNWKPIQLIIKSLERLIHQSGVPESLINGSIVVHQANNQSDIMKCFVNPDRIVKGLPQNRLKAVIVIQASMRRWKAQKDIGRLRIMVEKVKLIQKITRNYLLYKKTRRLIFQRNLEIYTRFKQTQSDFKSNWQRYDQRVEVHVCGLSYEEMRRLTMEKFLQKQNSQLTRIFGIKDPNVSIIYVAPYDLQAEIISYFYKILELGELPNFRERLHFIWPENHTTFPSHSSTTRLLLYSPKCLKRIRSIIRNKRSMIVPAYPSNDDILLSEALGCIPLYSGEPQLHLVNSTKSGCKRVFQNQKIPCAPGAIEIYDEKELINTLAILIVNNPQIEIWLLKIDDESGGRGIASLEARKLGIQRNYDGADSVVIVAGLLQSKLASKLHICYPNLFKNYQEYLLAFTRKGGIIEACPNCGLSQVESPSLFFKIDPNGTVHPLGTYDKIRINDFQTIACSSPKQSLPNINVQYMCENLGKSLYEKGIFGFIQLDLVAFTQNQQPMFWAIGLDCFLNPMSSSCFYFDFLMRGNLDPMTGSYSVPIKETNPQRSYIYCPYIINEGLSSLQYKTFFQLCRLESVSFNLEKKQGSTFILVDSLQSGFLSLLTVGNYYILQLQGDCNNSALQYMSDALEFLSKNVGRGNETQEYQDSRTDKIRMMGVLQKIKYLLKRYDDKSLVNKQNNIYL